MHFISFQTVVFTLSLFALSACGGGGSKLSSPAAEPGVSSSSDLLSSSAVSFSSISSSNASLISSSSLSSSSSLNVSFSSNSNSSLNSSAANAGCTDSVGDVFINGACPGWSHASIYERNTATPSIFREIRDGSPGDLVTQNIIDSGVAGRDQVLDVQFNSRSPELNGVLRMFNLDSAPDGVDMSSYATGKLIFDIKIIAAGDEHPDLDVVIECGWPCNSHSYAVRIPTLNSWQTVELSIKDLIAEGLDIHHVTTGFLIVPTWGRQANVHFQLDNIRWIKGAPEPVMETVCFANHMGSKNWFESLYYIDLRSFSSSDLLDYTVWLGQTMPDVVLHPQWDSMSDSWGLATSELLDSLSRQPLSFPGLSECASRGILSAYVYLPASYVADGKMRVGLYIIESSGQVHQFTAASLLASAMTPDGWTKLQVKLEEFPPVENARFVGVFFDANGKLPSVSGDIRLDSFVISRGATP